jgi:hypothetical protein
LGDLPGGEFWSYAFGISGNGQAIVGTARTALGNEAFIWDDHHGIRNLRSVLMKLGVNLDGRYLVEATDVSSDGNTITGWGIGPAGIEAWIAVLPGQSPLSAKLDIKPGSCPNPLNVRSRGVLPVAIVGTGSFDVAQIDPGTLSLARADGIGGSVSPLNGPPGPGIEVEDVATPFEGELCDCHELTGDGMDDMSLKFSTEDIVVALELGSMVNRTELRLTVSGLLLDQTPFEGDDSAAHAQSRARHIFTRCRC